MQKYEIMAIVANSVKESEAEKTAKKAVSERISELGGSVSFEDFWGARGFAYKIKNEKWGYYFVAQFEVDPTKISEFRRDLNLNKNIVRFLISKVAKGAPEPRKYSEMQKENAAIEAKKVKESAKNSVAGENEKKTEQSAPEAKKTAETDEKRKDEVDKKLDKILEDSSLDL